jgi:hypothetical protein
MMESVEIDRRPGDVFSHVVDFSHFPDLFPGEGDPLMHARRGAFLPVSSRNASSGLGVGRSLPRA